MSKDRDNFRFMDNFDMTIAPSEADGGERVERVTFGKWYCADRIVVCEDDHDFVDVFFKNGEVGRGVHKDLIELRGIQIECPNVTTDPEHVALLHKIFGPQDDDPTDTTEVEVEVEDDDPEVGSD